MTKHNLPPKVSTAPKKQIVKVANKVKLGLANKDLNVLIPPGTGSQKPLSCVSSPGLVHLWKGEGSGEDSVGDADFQLNGGATYAPGKVGQSFYFDTGVEFIKTEPLMIGEIFKHFSKF